MEPVTEAISLYEIGGAGWSIRTFLDHVEHFANQGEAEGLRAYADTRMDLIRQAAKIQFRLATFPPLPKTKRAAEDLIEWLRQDVPGTIALVDLLYEVRQAIESLTTILYAEVKDCPLYYASPKGRHDMTGLIDKGPYVSEEVGKSLSETARTDLLEAGRCLAFGRPTAVGFHLFRAAESLILAYLDLFDDRPEHPADRSWGRYIPKLRKHNVAKKITDVLDFIREEYRNPITHPKAVLTLDEAIHLMPLVMSVIDSMARDLIKRRAKKAGQ